MGPFFSQTLIMFCFSHSCGVGGCFYLHFRERELKHRDEVTSLQALIIKMRTQISCLSLVPQPQNCLILGQQSTLSQQPKRKPFHSDQASCAKGYHQDWNQLLLQKTVVGNFLLASYSSPAAVADIGTWVMAFRHFFSKAISPNKLWAWMERACVVHVYTTSGHCEGSTIKGNMPYKACSTCSISQNRCNVSYGNTGCVPINLPWQVYLVVNTVHHIRCSVISRGRVHGLGMVYSTLMLLIEVLRSCRYVHGLHGTEGFCRQISKF